LRAARRNGTVVVLGAWLFVCCIAVACVVSYEATPPVVSGREAGHWLRTELPPHVSRSLVMAFIARHWNKDQTVTFDTTDREQWITVTYSFQGWLSWGTPDVEIYFEIGTAGRLVSVSVSEIQTTS
jgi:hypothetical protein